MEQPPLTANINLSSGQLNSPWAFWFDRLYAKFNRYGTTANRPTKGVEIGDQYFDNTLGFPIWAKSINPIVWVRYDGTTV